MKLTTIWRAMRRAENLRSFAREQWFYDSDNWPLPEDYLRRRRQVHKFGTYLYRRLEEIDDE